MSFITFIYKVGKSPKTYYGKYWSEYISDDHEGLDNEVRSELQRALHTYRQQKSERPVSKPKVIIGVLAFVSDEYVPAYSTENEIKCFDFYRTYDKKIYINGRLNGARIK